MKKILLLCVLAGLGAAAQATEYGRVISSVPVVGQVTSPQRSCWDETVEVRQPRSHGGTIIGGITGALIGSAFGRGSGNAAATAGGAVVGAMLGSEADRDAQSELRTVRRCQTIQTSQSRTTGYDVTYEYAGQRYTTRMANPPGEWVPLQVSVEGAQMGERDAEDGYVVIEDEPTVVYQPARVYAPPPPVYFGIGLGYHRSWGHGHHGYHGHHR